MVLAVNIKLGKLEKTCAEGYSWRRHHFSSRLFFTRFSLSPAWQLVEIYAILLHIIAIDSGPKYHVPKWGLCIGQFYNFVMRSPSSVGQLLHNGLDKKTAFHHMPKPRSAGKAIG